MGRVPMRRAVLVASLALIASMVAGCASVKGEVASAKVSRGTEQIGIASVTPQGAKVKLPENRYVAITAKKNRTDARAAIRVPCDLWAPFRWEITIGIFDPEKVERTDGAIGGTELDERGPFPPNRFYGMSVQATSGGLNAFAFTHNSSTPIGSFFFAGAHKVQCAIEADLDTMTFFARPVGSTTWTTIATFPFTNQTTPLLPSIGAFLLADKGQFGFDDFRVVSNGTPPAPETTPQRVSRLIWEAAHGLVESLHGLDGATPDYEGAAAALTASEGLLGTARTAAEELQDAKTAKKVGKDLKKALDKVGSALSRAEKGEKASKALKRLEDALERLIKASARAYPDE